MEKRIPILLEHLPKDVTADELFDVLQNIYHEETKLKMAMAQSLVSISLKNFVHGKYLISRLVPKFKDENEMMAFIDKIYPDVSKLFGKTMTPIDLPQPKRIYPVIDIESRYLSAYNEYHTRTKNLTVTYLLNRLYDSEDLQLILGYYTKIGHYFDDLEWDQANLAIIIMLLIRNLHAIIGNIGPEAPEIKVLMPLDRRGYIYSLTQIISEYLRQYGNEIDSIHQVYYQLSAFGIIRDIVVAHLVVNSGILELYQEITLIDGLLCPSNNIKIERMTEFEYYYLIGFRDIDELKMIMKKNPILQYNDFLSRIFGLTVSLKYEGIEVSPIKPLPAKVSPVKVPRVKTPSAKVLPVKVPRVKTPPVKVPRAWDLIFPETLTRTFPELNKQLRDPFTQKDKDLFVTLNDFHASYDHRVFPIKKLRSYPMNRNMFLLYHSPPFLAAVRMGNMDYILTLNVPLSRSMISTYGEMVMEPVFIAIKNVGINEVFKTLTEKQMETPIQKLIHVFYDQRYDEIFSKWKTYYNNIHKIVMDVLFGAQMSPQKILDTIEASLRLPPSLGMGKKKEKKKKEKKKTKKISRARIPTKKRPRKTPVIHTAPLPPSPEEEEEEPVLLPSPAPFIPPLPPSSPPQVEVEEEEKKEEEEETVPLKIQKTTQGVKKYAKIFFVQPEEHPRLKVPDVGSYLALADGFEFKYPDKIPLNPNEKIKVSWKYSIVPGFKGYLLHIISFQPKKATIAVSQLMMKTSQEILYEYKSEKTIKDQSIGLSGISHMHQIQIGAESLITFDEEITQECSLKFQDQSSATEWDFDLEFIVWYAPTPQHYAHQVCHISSIQILILIGHIF